MGKTQALHHVRCGDRLFLLPLIWMPPTGTQMGRFIYLVLMLSIYAVAFSLFSVPYGALASNSRPITTNGHA